MKQNHVSFPEFAQNGSAKQFANGTNSSLNDKSNTKITIVDTNNTSHESFESTDLEYNVDPRGHCKKIRHNKTKRKYSHSLSKYRRLELGNVLLCCWQTKCVSFFIIGCRVTACDQSSHLISLLSF